MPDMLTAAALFTVVVRNFKDADQSEAITLHGVFTDFAEAQEFARLISEDAYPDFISATVSPLQGASVSMVNQAQRIGWLPDLD